MFKLSVAEQKFIPYSLWKCKHVRKGGQDNISSLNYSIFFKLHRFFVIELNCEGLQEPKCLVKYSPHSSSLLYRLQVYLTWRLQCEWDWKKNCPPDSYTHHKNYRTETKGWHVWLTCYIPFLSTTCQSITSQSQKATISYLMTARWHLLLMNCTPEVILAPCN